MRFVGFLVLIPLSFGSLTGVAFAETLGDDTASSTPASLNTEGSAGDSGTPAEEGAFIKTGDAGAGANVGNTANTNITDTTGNASSTPEMTEGDTASSTPELLTTEEEATTTASTTVTNTNEATTTNTVSASAATGDNSAEGGGDSVIDTGDAFAYANIINVVNTNILNSNGFLFFLNSLFGNGTLDLNDYFSFFENGGGEGSPCTLESCEGGGATLNVKNDNNATITNTVIVRSTTGGNNATSTSGSANIYTGDAYAAANVFNLANTNITNSNYLLFAFNNFGDYDGDVLLPGENFFSHLLGANGSSPSGGDVTVHNTNEATVENSVNAEANTGENSANNTGTSSAFIQTGNAYAGSNVANVVNTNLFGGSTVIMMFRIYGNWSGSVFGTPPGISWAETPYGVQLFNTPEETDGAPAENSDGTLGGSLHVENNNTALIKNNVQVYALTGENKAYTENGQAAIRTGNAYAGANVANVVNTNIVGKNLMFLFFNIFGNWRGNISFGQPDLLTVGSAHSEASSIGPGSDITYNFTVSNLGSARATNVKLKNIFDDTFLSFDEHDSVFPEGITWNIGNIPANGSVNVSYMAHVGSDIPYGETLLRASVTATLNETDSDPSNNTEVIDVMALRSNPSSGNNNSGGTGVSYTPDPVLKITKTSNASSTVAITASSTVDYTIVVNNEGGMAYHAVLVDTITDEAEKIIHEEYWELGEILPNEEITVTYTVVFNASTTPGVYKNHAQVLSIGRHPSVNPFYGYFADSAVVTSDVIIVGNEVISAPELAPAPTCEPYLRGFIRTGANNDPAEVTKLQQFLKTYEGFTDLAVTGTYNSATLAAVKALQSKYRDDILGPWGLERNTGFVYFTTKKKINELYCAGQAEFALSLEEQLEVNAFKALIGRLKTQVNELPEFTQVGVVNAANEGIAAVETPESGTENNGNSLVAGAIESLRGDANKALRSVTDAVKNGVGRMVSWLLFNF